MKIFWWILIGVAALFGIIMLWGAIHFTVDERRDQKLIREANSQPDPILIQGIAVETELGSAVVNSEGRYYFFEDGITWEQGRIGSRVSGTGNVYWERKYTEGSLELKKSKNGLILYQPKLNFSATE